MPVALTSSDINTIVAFVFIILCQNVCVKAVYIQNGKCFYIKPYTMKTVGVINNCIKNCGINKACTAVEFDRLSKLCSFYDSKGDIKTCPGKYLVLKSDTSQVLMFFYVLLNFRH